MTDPGARPRRRDLHRGDEGVTGSNPVTPERGGATAATPHVGAPAPGSRRALRAQSGAQSSVPPHATPAPGV